MPTRDLFHTETALALGLKELFKQLQERLSLTSPVKAFLAGGMAVICTRPAGSQLTSKPSSVSSKIDASRFRRQVEKSFDMPCSALQ
jgi:hypothetical protein